MISKKNRFIIVFFAGKLSFEDYVREIDYDGEEEEEEQGLDPDDEDWTNKKSAPPKKKKRKGSPHRDKRHLWGRLHKGFTPKFVPQSALKRWLLKFQFHKHI